ncbi:MAG: Metal-dependent hydrolases of the beta-lactamase superfamily III [uncultured Thermomicrobiales bacterium]|uniref:Metal-dependent hydrolases of the beta-lactamase superfamily III n=1 Tax=uncultured Thermomicrobiales bacterium TaxID=1645740 RepID=A0A6J4VYA2_9BACT|nr:MAG: Metal-dependent hydrolases of the beta-lactamase superfamily III [uncultured Thermomicrobiales bacterium]
MELTILGGSAATPNAGDASSGYLVSSGATSLLIDCGSGVVSRLRTCCDPRSLSGVVISHLHSDHTLDLIALRYGLQYTPPGPSVAIPLHLPPGGKDFLARLADIFALGNERATNFWESVLSPHEYSDHLASGEPLRIGDLAISFAPMVHYIPVWALRIEEVSTGRTLTYSADTGPAAPLVEFAADSDLFLCEATLLQQAPSEAPDRRGHLTATEAGTIATTAGVRRLVLTHLWTELGFERYLADARTTFAGPVDIARSGITFSI